jgi:hypothetical protein
MAGEFKHIRVEPDKLPAADETTTVRGDMVVGNVVPIQTTTQLTLAPKPDLTDVTYWRRMAVQAGERLTYAENQCNDLRKAADDARQRFGKYKMRLDRANQDVNELQARLILKSAECDAMREQLAKQDGIAQKVHAFRQSLLDGPLWELFAELAVSPPLAGVETTDA